MDRLIFIETKSKCTKIVPNSKYEKTDPDQQEWWNNLFKRMEDTRNLPTYRKKTYLRDCFTAPSVQDVIELCSDADLDVDEESKPQSTENIIEDTPREEIHYRRRKTTKSSLIPEEQYSNPYLSFIKRSAKEARIWRPKRKPTLDELPLIKKADILTEQIATEYDDWFSQIGGDKKSDIDKDVIIEIFQLMYSFPMATSLRFDIREFGSVPKQVAKAVNCPEMADGARLKRQIKVDLLAEKREPRSIAFNKCLPDYLKCKQIKTDRSRFSDSERLKAEHEDLTTMATVWRGITELFSTRSYCSYLLEHPETPPPPYLLAAGLMDEKFLSEPYLDTFEFDFPESAAGKTSFIRSTTTHSQSVKTDPMDFIF